MHLYHYTDAQAVHSVLSNRKLWLTDLRFMNDSTELRHGLKWFKEGLSGQPYGLFYDSNFAGSAISYLADAFDRYEDADLQETPIFSTSFSEVDDLLSQWRAYGGYSIAFDRDCLEENGLRLSSCVYDDVEKAHRASSDLSDAVACISNEMATSSGCIGVSSIDAMTALIDRAATFKDSGFSEEREVRLTAYSHESEVRFRHRSGVLVPFIELELPAEAIVGVRVGPIRDQNLAFSSLQMLARQVERDHQSNGGSIEWCLQLEKSATPYRE